jgi:ubiquinone/menaquinone biosynthesis C-methylase UbiE
MIGRLLDVIREFDLRAENYNKYTIWLEDVEISSHLINRIRELPHEVSLDLGGGTGQLAKAASCYGGRWIVLDPSPGMLRQADSNLVRVQAQAEHLPFANASVDLTVARSMLSYVDVTSTLAECARTLKPGMHLMVAEKIIGRFEEEYSAWYNEVSALRSPGKHCLTAVDIQKAVVEAGLEIKSVKEVSRAYRMPFIKWLSRSGTIPAESQEKLRALFAQLPMDFEEKTGVRVNNGVIELCADWLILEARKP